MLKVQTPPGIDTDHQFADPCEAAAKASLDCMERSHYNREEVSCYDSLTVETKSLTTLVFRLFQSVSRV